jgi:hypothetical protein
MSTSLCSASGPVDEGSTRDNDGPQEYGMLNVNHGQCLGPVLILSLDHSAFFMHASLLSGILCVGVAKHLDNDRMFEIRDYSVNSNAR